MYRVLITDDEKIEREGIKFLLAQEEGEYEIHEAANGRQALNVLRSEEIDFLLTDIKMPHMDGWNYQDVPRKKIRHCRS